MGIKRCKFVIALTTGDRGDVATAYMYRSSMRMIQIGKLLGKDVSRYEAVAPKIRDAWQKEYITSDGKVSPETQANYVRALHFGIAPEVMRDQMAKNLIELIRKANNHLGTGFLSTVYLLPLLADLGYADVAFDILYQDTEPSWLYMRRQGATTVWENWDGIVNGKASASLNHYSKGAVISFMHHYIAGLKMTSPAYKTFEVKPVIGRDVNRASTRVRTLNGEIAVEWQKTGDTFNLTVHAPSAAKGKAVLPDGSIKDLVAGINSFSTKL